MRTRKNKKYLKKRKNKTRKYGGVATLLGKRTSVKSKTYAQELDERTNQEREKREARSEAKKKARSSAAKSSKTTPIKTFKLTSTIRKKPFDINKMKLIKFLKARTDIKKDIQHEYNIKSSNPGKYGDFPKVDFQRHFKDITDINELIKNLNNIAKKHIANQSYGTDAELRKWFETFKNDVIPNYTTIKKIDNLAILLNMPDEINSARENRIKKIIQELDIPNNKNNLNIFLESPSVKNNPSIVQKLQIILM